MTNVIEKVKTQELSEVIEREKVLSRRIMSVSPGKIVKGVVTEHIVITR